MRTRRLIVLVGAGAAAIIIALAMGLHGYGSNPNEAAEDALQGRKAVPVVLAPARSMTFERRVVVSGSVEAKRYALVSARLPGTLDAVFVDEGDRVEANKTRLFQTDAVKLKKAVAIAEQNLTVAECSVREKEAMLEKNVATREQAQRDLARYRELLGRNAIAMQVVEQQEAEAKRAEADMKHARSLVELAKAQYEQAQLNLTIAKKDLDDSLVKAPIDGRVSQRLREPGEMAGPGTPVLRLDDLATLEVSVFLPEQYYARIEPGRTTMRIRVGDVDLPPRPVEYKSPTVHPRLRTFEVKGQITDPPAGVVPGCLAEVTIRIESRSGVGVPVGSIETRGGQSVVFTVAGDRARRLPVVTGLETDGWREIVQGIEPGTPVVTMGQFLIEDGVPVVEVRQEAAR